MGEDKMGSLRNIRSQERLDELRAAAAFGQVYTETVTEEERRVLVPMYGCGYRIFQLKGRGQRFSLGDSLYWTYCTPVRKSIVVSLLDKGLIERTEEKTHFNYRVVYMLSEKARELMSQYYHAVEVYLSEINRRARANPSYIADNFCLESKLKLEETEG